MPKGENSDNNDLSVWRKTGLQQQIAVYVITIDDNVRAKHNQNQNSTDCITKEQSREEKEEWWLDFYLFCSRSGNLLIRSLRKYTNRCLNKAWSFINVPASV